MTPEQLAEIGRSVARGDGASNAQASDLLDEVHRLTSRVEDLEEAVRWWRNWRSPDPGPKP